MKPFAALSVIEIGGSIAGAYCARLFTTSGAQVTRVGRDALTEAQRHYLHDGKQHVEVAPPDLFPGADVIIESAPNGPLTSLEIDASAAVRVRISPYGSSGHYASWRATDATLYAHAGHMQLIGDPDREPLSGPPHHPTYLAGLFAFMGAMAALLDRERHDRLHEVEVAHFEVMAALHQFNLMRYQFGGEGLRRMGNRYTGPGQPNGLYETSDGWVAISAPSEAQCQMLLTVTDALDLFDDPRITIASDFQLHPALIDGRLIPWLKQRTTEEVVDLFQSARIPTAPATPVSRLVDDPHLRERDFWRQVDGVTVPGPPFRVTGQTGAGDALEAGDPDQLPLAGVRVLDLTRVWAGPLAARLLAELGADVIRVEAPGNRGPKNPPAAHIQTSKLWPNNEPGSQPWNRGGSQIKYSLQKRSVVLDLTREEGRATFERLVPNADIVIENYSPRVMPQFGLDEHRLHELNPALIYTTMPGYGRSGPAMNWVAYGSTVDSHAGLSHRIGYPGHTPWKCGVAFPDPVAGLHAVAAILVALWRRPEQGGVTIEVAQFEATLAVIGDVLVEAQRLGDDPPVDGNRHPQFVPHGVYPAAGDDRWIAAAVLDDAGWRALCAVAGLPTAWQAEDASMRRAHYDEIDAAVAAWTTTIPPLELAAQFQSIGVAAAPVLDAPGVLADPQLVARSALAEIDQPEAARFLTPRSPVHFSGYPDRLPLRRGPLLGEHNREVLTEVAGLTADEIDELLASGVASTEPPN